VRRRVVRSCVRAPVLGVLECRWSVGGVRVPSVLVCWSAGELVVCWCVGAGGGVLVVSGVLVLALCLECWCVLVLYVAVFWCGVLVIVMLDVLLC
jgi:hypothetical protein